ncbi:MAG: helix-turn-helix transcriptional regulator [bacterium]|nr:helix-turn-helix transcriptional regulator [bacterium]
MKRKELAKDTAIRLRKIRKTFNLSTSSMADKLNVERCSYNRNEKGETIPDPFSLYSLGNSLNISLDWLIREEGPMLYTEKMTAKKEENETPKPKEIPQPLPPDLNELFEHMKHIPRLRFEILAQFHKFKQEHKDLVQQEMPKGN